MVFWRYFCAALDNIFSDISLDTEYVFSSQELLKAKIHLSILIDSLMKLSFDSLLILDDFHFITNEVILDDLSQLIAYLPANMHLILISRITPQLKIARLSLEENLLRICTKDLRFSSGEIYQYYQARGYFLQKEEVQKIESYTEGWAVALVAVTLSLKDEQDWHHVINDLGSGNLHIDTYLAEEVFQTWIQDWQDFLIKTSIVDRLCGSLCEAITEVDGSRLLKELYEQSSFLVALDNEGTWFRYHHLFLDYLHKQLKNNDVATLQNLHHRAGEWLKTNGFFYEAIEHFLQGAHYEMALLLIEKHGGFLIRRGEYARVISWIEKLPEKYSENAPVIMLLKATYFTVTNDLKNAQKCLESIELARKEKRLLSEDFTAEYMLVKANLFLMEGNIENALPAIIEASARGITQVRNTNYLDINLFDISIYRAKYNIFIKMLRTNQSEYDSFSNNYRSMISTNPGYAPLVVGEFYYESDRLGEALPKLLAAVDEAVHAHCPGALVPAMVTLAKIRRAHGDLSGALEVIKECETQIEPFRKPHWGYMLKAFKVRLYIDLDEHEQMDRWLTESRLGLYHDIIRTREYELIVLARVLIANEHYQDAHLLLNRLLNFAEELKRSHSIVEITNLLAITALKDWSEALALEYLAKALAIGIEEGYIRSFVDELEPMAQLLELYCERHQEKDRLAAYAQDLLNRIKNAIRLAPFPVGPNTVEKLLTPTELKVFHCLLKAYNNPQIAEELGITLRTVKAHTGSIYHKLGVKNRLQCLNTFKNIEY